MGWFDTLKDFAGSVYSGIKQTVGNWSQGFQSAPGNYFFCGAGNPLDDKYVNENLPKANESDKACFQHDKEYEVFKKNKDAGKINNRELRDLVRDSDNRLISNLQKSKGRDLGSYMSEYAIKGKRLLEDLGFLNPNKFIT